MNYPLLVTICSLFLGLLGMERWCSWRLGMAQGRGCAHRFFSPKQSSKEPTLADSLRSLFTKLERPS